MKKLLSVMSPISIRRFVGNGNRSTKAIVEGLYQVFLRCGQEIVSRDPLRDILEAAVLDKFRFSTKQPEPMLSEVYRCFIEEANRLDPEFGRMVKQLQTRILNGEQASIYCLVRRMLPRAGKSRFFTGLSLADAIERIGVFSAQEMAMLLPYVSVYNIVEWQPTGVFQRILALPVDQQPDMLRFLSRFLMFRSLRDRDEIMGNISGIIALPPPDRAIVVDLIAWLMSERRDVRSDEIVRLIQQVPPEERQRRIRRVLANMDTVVEDPVMRYGRLQGRVRQLLELSLDAPAPPLPRITHEEIDRYYDDMQQQRRRGLFSSFGRQAAHRALAYVELAVAVERPTVDALSPADVLDRLSGNLAFLLFDPILSTLLHHIRTLPSGTTLSSQTLSTIMVVLGSERSISDPFTRTVYPVTAVRDNTSLERAVQQIVAYLQTPGDAAFNHDAPAPDIFCDPITHEVLRDPVLAPDGLPYERGNPELVNRFPVGTEFYPNRVLSDIIAEWQSGGIENAKRALSSSVGAGSTPST